MGARTPCVEQRTRRALLAAAAASLVLLGAVLLTTTEPVGSRRLRHSRAAVDVESRFHEWKPVPGHKVVVKNPCRCVGACESELTMRYPFQGEHSPKVHMCSVRGEGDGGGNLAAGPRPTADEVGGGECWRAMRMARTVKPQTRAHACGHT